MANTAKGLLSYVRLIVGAWREDPRDDAQLLAQFVEARDERAFTVLLWRHGPLVWRTCTRVLGDGSDAEDAFQATFLALAHKAGQLRGDTLAGWLHRVAQRAALNAEAGVRRRRSLEQRLRVTTQSATAEDTDRAELYAALDEELAGLPEQLRVPLLLHYLEGKSQIEVARLLGCARSVVQYRLARGESLLKKRLERRGLAVGVGSVSVLLASPVVVSAMSARLIESTARAAVAFCSGTLTGGAAEAARAVVGALPSSIEMTILRKSLGVVLACCLGLGGAALVTCQALTARPDEPTTVSRPTVVPPVAERSGQDGAKQVSTDLYGDPLPQGALARLGTTRLRHLHNGVCSVAFVSDGKSVASAGWDGRVCLWEIATGKEIRTFRGHKECASSVAFTLDGKTAAVGGHNEAVYLWEMTTGKLIQTLKGHKGVSVVALSPDGKTVAVGGDCKDDKTVHLLETSTGREIYRQRHKEEVLSAAFSSNGETLATGGNDGTVRLVDVASGKETHTLKGHKGPVRSMAFSPDGKIVASGGDDKVVYLWNVVSGKEIRTLQGHKAMVFSLAFSPDGKTLASGDWVGTVRLWERANGKPIRTLPGSRDIVFGMTFSPDGKTLASAERDGKVRLWEVATGKEIETPKGHERFVFAVAFAPNGKTVATGGYDSTVRLWETVTGKEIDCLERHNKEHGSWVSSVAFSPDGKTMASAGRDRTVRLWNAATGKEIRTLKGLSEVSSVAFSPDGKTLASGEIGETALSGAVRLWETATGKEIRTLKIA